MMVCDLCAQRHRMFGVGGTSPDRGCTNVERVTTHGRGIDTTVNGFYTYTLPRGLMDLPVWEWSVTIQNA